MRRLFDEQIVAAEREMAGFLVKTPYVLLLSVTGINVVSAARLAGEAVRFRQPLDARPQMRARHPPLLPGSTP